MVARVTLLPEPDGPNSAVIPGRALKAADTVNEPTVVVKSTFTDERDGGLVEGTAGVVMGVGSRGR